MGTVVPEILIAPLLIAVATLVGRRWGARAAGLVSAFPAVVGPVLLIIAQQRGDLAAERAASATLLGLVALSGFALAYARAADQPHLVASARRPRGDAGVRMALTAALILLLTVASEMFGPVVGGMLAALPVFASVLVVFTHRMYDSEATIGLLGGMLTGMSGFVAFCAVIALLAAPAGTAVAFAVATVCAIAAQALMLIVASEDRFLPASRLPGDKGGLRQRALERHAVVCGYCARGSAGHRQDLQPGRPPALPAEGAPEP